MTQHDGQMFDQEEWHTVASTVVSVWI